MKVLLVSSTFPPRRFGGITAASYNVAKALVNRGHELTVYTTDVNDSHSRLPNVRGIKNIDGINVHYFRNISNALASKRLYWPKGLVAELRRELKRFDIIHLNDFRVFQSIIVHHYAQKYAVPYVLQAHGSLPKTDKQPLKLIYDWLWGYKLLADASKVIAVTETEAEQYKSIGVSEDKIEIVPNGIDLSEFENLPQRGEFRRKYGLADNQKVILYLNRIHKIKGPDLLVKAFTELSKNFSDVKLVIAGPDDGYLSPLKKLIAELKIEEKVLFTGLLYGEEKLKAYIDSDVYVLPSTYEIFAIGVLEACACGIPVVVTDRCGIAKSIDGQAGLVVPYDKEQLQRALQQMLNNDKMRRELGEGGKTLVHEQFTWPKIVEKLENVYLTVIR